MSRSVDVLEGMVKEGVGREDPYVAAELVTFRMNKEMMLVDQSTFLLKPFHCKLYCKIILVKIIFLEPLVCSLQRSLLAREQQIAGRIQGPSSVLLG
jgi:hypothetical protein